MEFLCDNMVIRDKFGRERIFKGFNVCIKSAPSLKGTIENNEKELQRMVDFGCNIIRLGVTWAIIEPEEGKYDNEALDILKKFVKECEEKNIYVILDMHQDLYSEYFYGDGAPDWAIDKSIKNKKQFAVWAEGYFYMDGVQKAFNEFWHNYNNVQSKFIKMWKYFVSYFDGCDNIIALDYLNEPYVEKNGRKIFLTLLSNASKLIGGKELKLEQYFNHFSDKTAFLLSVIKIVFKIRSIKRLKLILEFMDSSENFGNAVRPLFKYTEEFNKKYYQAFIDNISDKVGKKCAFDLFEHNYYSNLGVEFNIETKSNYVYSPHAYDIFVDSPLYGKYASNGRLKFILDQITANQKNMNVPVIFGEWGGGANGTEWISHIDYLLGEFEKRHWSNIYWGYNLDNETLNSVFVRPYPVAVCGNIVSIETNSSERIFKLKWETPDTFDVNNIKTEVFIPNKGVCEFDNQHGINELKIDY